MPNIIHCKDCKFNIRNPKYFYDKEKTLTFIWCQHFSDEDFCSRGKAIDDVEFVEEKEDD